MSEQTPNKGKNTGMAIIAYIIFFIPLLTEAKNDEFVKYHVKQGLLVFIAWAATMIVSMMPILGGMISWLLSIITTVLLVIGILNAAQGKKEPLPLIGKYAEQFKF